MAYSNSVLLLFICSPDVAWWYGTKCSDKQNTYPAQSTHRHTHYNERMISCFTATAAAAAATESIVRLRVHQSIVEDNDRASV